MDVCETALRLLLSRESRSAGSGRPRQGERRQPQPKTPCSLYQGSGPGLARLPPVVQIARRQRGTAEHDRAVGGQWIAEMNGTDQLGNVRALPEGRGVTKEVPL